MTGQQHPDIGDLTRFAMEVIRRAGDKALEFYGKGSEDLRFDEELVTEAELELADFFEETLAAKFPEHQIFGKSAVSKEYLHGQKGYLWVFDPLDGVANFQGGVPVWGTSLALLENFWPIFGVTYMPATGDIFHARADQQAFWKSKEIHVVEEDGVNNESLLLTYSRFHQHYRSAFPGKIRNLGGTAAHICYVASGRALGALIANVSYQDLAAAQIILKAAGGKLTKLDGSEFYLNEYLDGQRIEEHLIAAPPGANDSIRMYLERV